MKVLGLFKEFETIPNMQEILKIKQNKKHWELFEKGLEELEQIKSDKERSKIEYKGYYAYPYYSAEDKMFVGKVENTTDFCLFQGSTVDEMIKDFQEAVEMLIELEEK